MNRTRLASCVLGLLLLSAAPLRGAELLGHWAGSINVSGVRIAADIDIRRDEQEQFTGTISIPAQRVKNIPLANIKLDGAEAHFEMNALSRPASFTGEIVDDGSRMEGTFEQSGFDHPFSLRRETRPEAIAETVLDGFDAYLEEARKSFEAPGLAAVVATAEKVVYVGAGGYRDLNAPKPIEPDTLFLLGRCTEAFTTFALATLVDDGRAGWDQPIVQTVPGFNMRDGFAGGRTTLRDIAVHRTGVPGHRAAWVDAPGEPADVLDRIAYLEPSAEFRTRFQPSPVMYVAAGQSLAHVIGEPFEAAMHQRVLEPLGMTEAALSPDAISATDNFAAPHVIVGGELQRLPFRDYSHVAAGVGLAAGAEQLADWLRVHLGGGAVADNRIVSEARLAELHTPQILVSAEAGDHAETVQPIGYAMGWMVDLYRGHRRLRSEADLPGYSAVIVVLPAAGVAAAAMTNVGGSELPEAVTREAIDRVLRLDRRNWAPRLAERQRKQGRTPIERPPRQPDTAPSRALVHFTGTYEHPAYGRITVDLKQGDLAVDFQGTQRSLRHWHYDVFRIEAGGPVDPLAGRLVQFRTDLAGKLSALAVQLDPALPPIEFTRTGEAEG